MKIYPDLTAIYSILLVQSCHDCYVPYGAIKRFDSENTNRLLENVKRGPDLLVIALDACSVDYKRSSECLWLENDHVI